MGNPIKVFFLEPTDRERRWLRRYGSDDKLKCKTGSYCNAMFEFGEADILYTPDGYIDGESRKRGTPPNSDPRWPTVCAACGRGFSEKDPFQLFGRQIYVSADGAVRCTTEEAPAGACWDAWWISDRRKDGPTGCAYVVGPDHRSLVVKCPDGHDWHIDHRASNCGLPNDDTHQCWVRHGKPEDGTLHVDKNGVTCSAGAGSIATGKWHGFLHNGHLIEC